MFLTATADPVMKCPGPWPILPGQITANARMATSTPPQQMRPTVPATRFLAPFRAISAGKAYTCFVQRKLSLKKEHSKKRNRASFENDYKVNHRA